MHKGFTLLELLVTLTILGVLIATAVPQYNTYRRRGFDYRAQSDLRNVAIAEEAYFLDAEKYLPCDQTTCTALPAIKAVSEGVILNVVTSDTDFIGTASHPKGTGKAFTWDSAAGGFQAADK